MDAVKNSPAVQRMIDAFEGRRPDRVPVFNQAIHSSIVSDVLGRTAYVSGGDARWASLMASFEGPAARAAFFRQYCRDTVEFALAVGEDAVRPGWWLGIKPNMTRVGANAFSWRSDDGLQFGRVVYEPDSRTVNEFNDWLAQADGVERLARWLGRQDAEPPTPDPVGVVDLGETQMLLDEAAGRVAVADATGCLGIPMFEPAWLELFALESELVGRYLQRMADGAIARLPALRRAGARVLNAGLDLCYNGGPAYSPRLFRTYVLPQLQRITAAAHELGMFYIYRTDGDTWPIGQMLFVESGVDGAGEIDYQAGMRLDAMRQAYPNLTLVGNLDCGSVLCDGSEADVREHTRRQLAATGGIRHVVSSSNAVISGTPTKNYLAMVDEARRFDPPQEPS